MYTYIHIYVSMYVCNLEPNNCELFSIANRRLKQQYYAAWLQLHNLCIYII